MLTDTFMSLSKGAPSLRQTHSSPGTRHGEQGLAWVPVPTCLSMATVVYGWPVNRGLLHMMGLP